MCSHLLHVASSELVHFSEFWFSEGQIVIPAKKKGCRGETGSAPQIVFFLAILLPSFSVMGTPQPWPDYACLGPMLSKEPPPLSLFSQINNSQGPACS